MNKSRPWAIAAVVFVVLLVIVLKSAVRAREGQPAGSPEPSAAASRAGVPGSQGTTASEKAETAAAEASTPGGAASSPSSPASARKPQSPAKGLPKLLELGSVTCHACQEMKPIIEELARELRGRVIVEFVDVVRHGEVADRYQIQAIPTQIFLDAEGKELFRHVGFYPKEEILAKMKELGMLR